MTILCSSVEGSYESASRESAAFMASSSTVDPLFMTYFSPSFDLMDYS